VLNFWVISFVQLIRVTRPYMPKIIHKALKTCTGGNTVNTYNRKTKISFEFNFITMPSSHVNVFPYVV
jgi:hypothetical protein